MLVLILVGAVDFARVFYTAIELTNGARAGAQYGAFTPARSSDFPGMQNAATAAAANLSGVLADPSRQCQCAADNGSSFSNVACTATCGAGQHFVSSVTV